MTTPQIIIEWLFVIVIAGPLNTVHGEGQGWFKKQCDDIRKEYVKKPGESVNPRFPFSTCYAGKITYRK